VTALLDQECELTARGDGVYERDTGRIWWGVGAQHGGYVMALAMTALDLELNDPTMDVQHCALHYMKPFVDGPFRAEVTVERRGRTMANATARLWSGGRMAGLVLASFATRRPIAEFMVATPPDVAPLGPDEAAPEPPFPVPTFDHFDLHPRIHDAHGTGTRRVAGWVVPRTPEIVDHRYLGLLADLWPPVIYHLWPPGVRAVSQSVDLTYHARSSLPRADLPPATPLLVALSTRGSMGGFVDEDVEIWTEQGELLAISRQTRFVHS
jgi:acyl-coenzyme A thioesterase PaaI-like protein